MTKRMLIGIIGMVIGFGLFAVMDKIRRNNISKETGCPAAQIRIYGHKHTDKMVDICGVKCTYRIPGYSTETTRISCP